MHTGSPQGRIDAQSQTEAKRVAINPEGTYWKNGIYLVPTSEIDGNRRWETIVLLLSGKICDENLKRILRTYKVDKQKVGQ